MVELPSPCWILSIWVYRKMEQSVVKRPRTKMTIRPIFFQMFTLSCSNMGTGMMVTPTSETMVTTAYAVNDGPGARHVPGIVGSHDLFTCKHAHCVSWVDTWCRGRMFAYRVARKDQAQRAAQVPGHDEKDGNPHHPAVCDVAGALEEPQVTDQEGNLEETDAHLIYRPPGVVGARVGNEVLLRTKAERQSEAIFRF
jgi:hypothetical protein